MAVHARLALRTLRIGLVLLSVLQCATTALAVLTGQYLLEGDANDSSGFARNGTLTGTTGVPDFVPGLYAGSTNALRSNFDTSTSAYNAALNQRVDLPGNMNFIRNAPGATLMAWVRPDVVGAVSSIVGVSETTGGTRGVIQFIANNQWRVLGRRADGGSNSNYVSSGLTPLTAVAGQTYFVVGVFDYANPDIRLYINGVQHTGGVLTNNFGAAGSNSVDNSNFIARIGQSALGTEPWRGLIDGVRIYDHALTASEILNIYQAESAVTHPAGDYNDNGTVDAADYTVWRDHLNQTFQLPNEVSGVSPGSVTTADYDEWKSRFGNAGTGSLAANAVPEPASAVLLVLAGVVICCARHSTCPRRFSSQLI